MKWLRECLTEYARHPLLAFVGLAIIAASLVTAATVFMVRHAGSGPSTGVPGSGQSVRPAAPSSRAPLSSPSPVPPSSVPLVPRRQ